MLKFQEKPIKNIIFDLGGVILNIDYLLTIDAFKRLGINQYDKLYTQAQQIDLFDNIEKGEITAQQFRNELKKLADKALTDQEINFAWNAMLLDLPKERLDLLSGLKDKYRTFLLSNTNEIHLEAYFAELKRVHGYKNLSPFFEDEFYSHEIGLRKPDQEIFRFVLEQKELMAEETLFIDDSIQHIEGAKKAGINAYHLTNGETILDFLTRA